MESGNPGIKIGKTLLKSQAILLQPDQGTVVRVNAKPYRGALLLYRTAAGKLNVVNQLNLEEYLVSAVASEVGRDWPLEVLKAHAVVSRTMVTHRMWIQKERPFDVTADTGTHLYYGVVAETRKGVREAVQATEGQVLAYQGELLPATFHASCGGHTEDPRELWSLKGEATPLQGRPDPYCRDLKHYRWKGVIPMKEFLTALGEVKNQLGGLLSCEVTERNASGRARSVLLTGPAGNVTLTGKKLRELLGWNRLRSLNFTAEVTPDEVVLEGLGWGHGVGFCQWGAYGMTLRGHTMEEILEFYFPGAQRRNLKGLPGFDS